MTMKDSRVTDSQQGAVLTYVLLVLAVVVIAAGGVWFWQQRSVTSLNNRVGTLQKELEATKQQPNNDNNTDNEADRSTNAATSTDIITGQATLRTGEGYQLDCMILPGRLDEFWVEYGETSSNLSKETEHSTQELGLGEAGNYGVFTRTIAAGDIKPGTMYFYRCVGEKNGQEVPGGLASFTTRK